MSERPTDLLMHLIRRLTLNDASEERKVEKRKIDDGFKQCDNELDELIKKNSAELQKAVQAYRAISSNLTNAQVSVKKVKECLANCKAQIQSKRHDLLNDRKEAIIQNHVVTIFSNLECISTAPLVILKYMKNHHYLHASEELVKVENLLRNLSEVKVIQKSQQSVIDIKQKMYQEIMDNLVYFIYKRFEDETYSNVSKLFASSEEKDNDWELFEDLKTDPRDDPPHFVTILIKALAISGHLYESNKDLKNSIHSSVEELTRSIAANISKSDSKTKNAVLVRYFDRLFNALNKVAVLHSFVISLYSQSFQNSSEEFSSYTMNDFWSDVQSVLQTILSAYLGEAFLGKSNCYEQCLSQAESINGFYNDARKKLLNKKDPGDLFAFEDSAFYSNNQEILRCKNISDANIELLCQPHVTNIAVIYNPLHQFCLVIESCVEAKPCILHKFLDKCVDEIVIETMKSKIESFLQSAASNHYVEENSHILHACNSTRPLYKVCMILIEMLIEQCQLWEQLPQYGDQIGLFIHNQQEDFLTSFITWINEFLMPQNVEIIELQLYHELHEVMRDCGTEITTKTLQKKAELIFSKFESFSISTPSLLQEMKKLALLFQSFDWVYLESEKILNTISSHECEALKKCLRASKRSRDLSTKCLHLMRLEVLVLIYTSLLPTFQRQHSFSRDDVEPNIIELCQNLTIIDETIELYVSPEDHRYVLDNLSVFVSTIFTRKAFLLKKLSNEVVRKLCRAIQHISNTLNGIVEGSGAYLERLHFFFELLFYKLDEMVHVALVKGILYQEADLTILLKLAHLKWQVELTDDLLQNYLRRLNSITIFE